MNCSALESPNEYVKVKTPSGQKEVNRWHTLGPGENSTVVPYVNLPVRNCLV